MRFNWKNSIIILIGVLLCIPLLSKILSLIQFFGLEQGEWLDYLGVLVGGSITFYILIKTDKANKESLMRQFQFQIKQEFIKDIRNELKTLYSNLSLDYELEKLISYIPEKFSDSIGNYKSSDSIYDVIRYLQGKKIDILMLQNNIKLYGYSPHIKEVAEDIYKYFLSSLDNHIQYINQLIDLLNNLIDTILSESCIINNPSECTKIKYKEDLMMIKNCFKTFTIFIDRNHVEVSYKINEFIRLIETT